MGKAPAFQFYVADFLCDTRNLSLPAKGAWIDLLCHMWRSEERGKITGTWDEIALLINSTVEDAKKTVAELIDRNICAASLRGKRVTTSVTVTKCNGKVTLINRRMHREAQELEKTRLRVRRHREKEDVKRKCDADVTPVSSSSSSSSSSKTVTPTTSSRKSDSGASTTSEPATGSGDGKVELTQAYLNAVRSVRYWAVCEEEERAWFSKRIRDNPRYERLDLTSCLERWRNSRHGLSERRRQGKGMNLPPEPRNDLLTWLDRDLERLKEGNGGQKHDQRGDAAEEHGGYPADILV